MCLGIVNVQSYEMINDIVDICRIVDYHYLNLLYVITKTKDSPSDIGVLTRSWPFYLDPLILFRPCDLI
jgi:hypothetical protein